tara:strand:- start:1092 stop:1292 length:201 start_codon:yes stop_codon:yes gene_type:complete
MNKETQIKKRLLDSGSISPIESIIRYSIYPKELDKICLNLRKKGYYIKKYEEILFYRYLLFNKNKN